MIRIGRYLPWIEAVFVVILVVGSFLFYQNLEARLLVLSLLGLTVTYVVSAYKPIEIISNGDEKFGMNELLAWTILPKVCWISCGISTLGGLVFFINSGNDSYKNMLFIGALTLGSALLIVVYLIVSGVKHIKVLNPVLFRVIPILSADCYLLAELS